MFTESTLLVVSLSLGVGCCALNAYFSHKLRDAKAQIEHLRSDVKLRKNKYDLAIKKLCDSEEVVHKLRKEREHSQGLDSYRGGSLPESSARRKRPSVRRPSVTPFRWL